MPPEQPAQNSYDFITSPPPPRRDPLSNLSVGGDSMAKRAMIVGGIGVAVIIGFVLVVSFISSLGKGDTVDLISIAQQQNEIARVAAEGSPQIISQDIKNSSVSIQLSVTSDQRSLLNFMLQHRHKKVSIKQLAATASLKTDQALATAQAASTFDETFKSIMQSKLNSYSQTVRRVFGQSHDSAERQLLSNEYSNAQLLLQQLGQAAPGS